MDTQQDIIIYKTNDNKVKIALYAKDGSIWLNQNQLADLFDTSKQSKGQHIINILDDKELNKDSVVKKFFTTASDGKNYEVTFYSLEMILAIGFRVRSKRGIQFRQWANQHLKEFMVKGFVMDDERLKNPDGRPDYFDELLERIRDIRASEKRFYQKVRKQVKELKEKGQQVILVTNRPFTESLADKVYYLPINETSLHLIQTIDQVKDIVKLSNR